MMLVCIFCQVSISYIETAAVTKKRQNDLKQYFFTCTCPRCVKVLHSDWPLFFSLLRKINTSLTIQMFSAFHFSQCYRILKKMLSLRVIDAKTNHVMAICCPPQVGC